MTRSTRSTPKELMPLIDITKKESECRKRKREEGKEDGESRVNRELQFGDTPLPPGQAPAAVTPDDPKPDVPDQTEQSREEVNGTSDKPRRRKKRRKNPLDFGTPTEVEKQLLAQSADITTEDHDRVREVTLDSVLEKLKAKKVVIGYDDWLDKPLLSAMTRIEETGFYLLLDWVYISTRFCKAKLTVEDEEVAKPEKCLALPDLHGCLDLFIAPVKQPKKTTVDKDGNRRQATQHKLLDRPQIQARLRTLKPAQRYSAFMTALKEENEVFPGKNKPVKHTTIRDYMTAFHDAIIVYVFHIEGPPGVKLPHPQQHKGDKANHPVLFNTKKRKNCGDLIKYGDRMSKFFLDMYRNKGLRYIQKHCRKPAICYKFFCKQRKLGEFQATDVPFYVKLNYGNCESIMDFEKVSYKVTRGLWQFFHLESIENNQCQLRAKRMYITEINDGGIKGAIAVATDVLPRISEPHFLHPDGKLKVPYAKELFVAIMNNRSALQKMYDISLNLEDESFTFRPLGKKKKGSFLLPSSCQQQDHLVKFQDALVFWTLVSRAEKMENRNFFSKENIEDPVVIKYLGVLDFIAGKLITELRTEFPTESLQVQLSGRPFSAVDLPLTTDFENDYPVDVFAKQFPSEIWQMVKASKQLPLICLLSDPRYANASQCLEYTKQRFTSHPNRAVLEVLDPNLSTGFRNGFISDYGTYFTHIQHKCSIYYLHDNEDQILDFFDEEGLNSEFLVTLLRDSKNLFSIPAGTRIVEHFTKHKELLLGMGLTFFLAGENKNVETRLRTTAQKDDEEDICWVTVRAAEPNEEEEENDDEISEQDQGNNQDQDEEKNQDQDEVPPSGEEKDNEIDDPVSRNKKTEGTGSFSSAWNRFKGMLGGAGNNVTAEDDVAGNNNAAATGDAAVNSSNAASGNGNNNAAATGDAAVNSSNAASGNGNNNAAATGDAAVNSSNAASGNGNNNAAVDEFAVERFINDGELPNLRFASVEELGRLRRACGYSPTVIRLSSDGVIVDAEIQLSAPRTSTGE